MYLEGMIHKLSVLCIVPWSKVLRYIVVLCILYCDITTHSVCHSPVDFFAHSRKLPHVLMHKY